MRILIISHEYPPIGGGGANACLNLSQEYLNKGHDVDVVTVWFDGLSEDEVISSGSNKLRIFRLKSRRRHLEHCGFGEMLDYLIKSYFFTNKLVKEGRVSGNGYDVCQVFFGIPSGPLGLYLKKKYHIPYVVRFGGGDIPGFQDRFKYIYKFIGVFLKHIWKNADALVANSEGLRKLAYDFCDKYQVDIIPNGVDTSKFYPSEKTILTDEKVTLLFISRLIKRKGLQYLIPNLRKIEKETSRKVQLLVVGDGPFRDELETIAKENETIGQVQFVGQKNKNELLEYYQKGDVFVFPSQKEGMPNAVLEAMACGLPVIMSPCQGSDELISGNGVITGENLTLFSVEVIEFLKLSNGEIRKMAEESRKRAVNQFSWGSVADNYLKLFNDINKRGD